MLITLPKEIQIITKEICFVRIYSWNSLYPEQTFFVRRTRLVITGAKRLAMLMYIFLIAPL